ncbi:MAG: GNAT family N-acetyltransferase [Gammaproteobacteria bacterium]|nr:GNAT family N-acetyltransferase [Gammaproteobacteria bacterium]
MIKTQRLHLRFIKDSDAEAIQDALTHRQIADSMISIPYPYSIEETKQDIKKYQQEQKSGKACVFVIEGIEDKNFYGLVEIRNIELEHSQAELSFWLATKAWGKGYMTEALQAIVNYCFKTLNLNRLYCYHMLKNHASGKTIKQSGFTQEGTLRQRVKKLGVFEDVALWAILRKDINVL